LRQKHRRNVDGDKALCAGKVEAHVEKERAY
jgi:hypothetical protein